MEIAELERALQKCWDRDHLAVYGDYLQAHGDPRGELIAIDLAGAPEHLAARRVELVRAWLGPLSARIHAETQFGFVTALHVTDPDGLARLDTPYIRGLTIEGTAEVVAAGVAALGARPRPWLQRLVIRHDDDAPRAHIVTSAHAAALAAATPCLGHLEVSGHRVFDETFVHPSAHRLTVSGHDALGSLSGTGPALEAVIELDFAFHRGTTLDHLATPAEQVVRGVLPPHRLPALRALDLSRNEPGSRELHHLGGRVDIYNWLRGSRLANLATLTLPSMRTPQHADDLVAIMKRMPGAAIAIARSYRVGPEPPPGVTMPPPRPWPARDQVHGRDALSIRMPDEPYPEYCDLSGPVELMEHEFDTMPPECRAAWTELWEFLDDLGWEDADGNDIVMELPAIVLQRALEPLDLSDLRRWSDLRDLLRRRAATLPETVSIKRYWGW